MTPSSASSSAEDSSVEGSDTETVDEDDYSASSDHESPPSTQPESKFNVVSQDEQTWQSNLAMNQAIVKGVFGKDR